MRMTEEHQTYQTDMHLDSCEYKAGPIYSLHHEKMELYYHFSSTWFE